MISDTDRHLIQRIHVGDQNAEKELFVLFRDRIITYVRHFIHSGSEDLNDIVSEIQLSLLINLRQGKFDLSKGNSLGTYTYGIARNKIREYLRSKKKITVKINGKIDSIFNSSAEESTVESEELRRMLRILIRNLKHKYREVLYLKFFEELSISEISEKINLPPHRVSERINYALKLLHKQSHKKRIFSILRDMMSIQI